jgi:hypothetical protein
MRILRTGKYELVEAKDIPTPFPPYAILSHTWISPKEEITYQDFKTRKEDIKNDVYKQKGWAKIKAYCDRAARDGWEWAWMDTCCIDKSNPADTQEAINAMFRWYQNAGVCYAYLDDVDADGCVDGHQMSHADETTDMDNVVNHSSALHQSISPLLIKAKWFTRGWTLQELLAPHYLIFLDREWRRIGTRESWAPEIKEASRIEAKHLTSFNPTDFMSSSIAMRLSWASRRQTTVEEDETYSLLGLFGISLPLIYGEGRWRAFNRLQRELIMTYSEDSIFSWTIESPPNGQIAQPLQAGTMAPEHEIANQDNGWGILAPSIRQFWDTSKILHFGFHDHNFSITNRGLETDARRWRSLHNPSSSLIRLNCGPRSHQHLGIVLRRVSGSYERVAVHQHYKIDSSSLRDWKDDGPPKSILVRTGNHSNRPTGSSVFVLQHNNDITIGSKYVIDFRTTAYTRKVLAWSLDSSTNGFLEKELVLEPGQLMFINIELHLDHVSADVDVIININENGFPTVGIWDRGDEADGWKRLGDPLREASQTYRDLANYLHQKAQIEAALPLLVTLDEGYLTVHMLPRPPRKHSLEMLPESGEFAQLREYSVTLSFAQHHRMNQSRSTQSGNKRSRII